MPTKLTSLATSACHLLSRLYLSPALLHVVERTVGLASTDPFRSSRVGAVTARKLIQYLKTTLYC